MFGVGGFGFAFVFVFVFAPLAPLRPLRGEGLGLRGQERENSLPHKKFIKA
jgi:hypothetical protein